MTATTAATAGKYATCVWTTNEATATVSGRYIRPDTIAPSARQTNRAKGMMVEYGFNRLATMLAPRCAAMIATPAPAMTAGILPK